MTNFEKYKDEILDLTEYGGAFGKVNNKLVSCHEVNCTKCEFLQPCNGFRFHWLYEEYKEPAPTLTPKERVFCEIANVHFNEIYRGRQGDLYISEDADTYVRINNESFQFIEPNTSYMISDLLKLEVE